MRFAGDSGAPVLPLLLAATGGTPAPVGQSVDDWDQAAAIPGNSLILPDQATQHQRGAADLDWQYPFFRHNLVKAGLLPAEAPPGNPKRLEIPAGMSVLEAIQAGVIR